MKTPWGGVSAFELPMGTRFGPDAVAGYYIDLTSKAEAPVWPPPWFPWPGYHRYIATAQWGLGVHERHLRGDDGAWLEAATGAANFLVESQEPDGMWPEEHPYCHTFHMQGPWVSAMAQGQCASFLVRLHLETGRDEYAAAAQRALACMEVDATDGGVRAVLAGRPFPEEYPTKPASFVLNGAIFASWGWHDVGVGLNDDAARTRFVDFVDLLAEELWRWDLGYWSRYDLYPHVVTNVASAPYHRLHVHQLRAMHQLAPRPEFSERADRFERYLTSSIDRTRAIAHKIAFRLLIPRNELLSGKLPWDHAEQAALR